MDEGDIQAAPPPPAPVPLLIPNAGAYVGRAINQNLDTVAERREFLDALWGRGLDPYVALFIQRKILKYKCYGHEADFPC